MGSDLPIIPASWRTLRLPIEDVNLRYTVYCFKSEAIVATVAYVQTQRVVL